MAFGRIDSEPVKHSLERVLELLRRQRSAALAWRSAEVEGLSARLEELLIGMKEELVGASQAEKTELAPLLRQAQELWRANRDIIGQSLALLRHWRRILAGVRALAYDRSGRPVEMQRAAASGRVA